MSTGTDPVLPPDEATSVKPEMSMVRVVSSALPPADAEAFKHRDATSYDPVSDDFARLTSRFSQSAARRLVDEAGIGPADRVLDVGTGTGVVALEAAARLSGGGEVTAIDLSEGMLATAVRLAAGSPDGKRIRWQAMDAERLSFPDGAFDHVLSLFALLHFPNPLAALQEMHRVLRPGGRLVVALGSRPSVSSTAGIRAAMAMLQSRIRQRRGLELVAPAFLDRLVRKEVPGGVLQEESHLARHGQDRSRPALALIARADFVRMRTKWVGFDHVIPTVEEFWDLQRTFSSFSRKRLGETSTKVIDKVRTAFDRESSRVLERGGTLRYRVGVLFISANRD